MKDTINILHDAMKPTLDKHECDFCKKEYYVFEVVYLNEKLTCYDCYVSHKNQTE